MSCGYFTAAKRFFPTRTFHLGDVEYVAGRTGLRPEEIKLDSYPKGTSSRQREFIMEFYGFKPSALTAASSLPKKSRVWYAPRSNPKSSSGAVSMS